jgi:Kef-type K+ transport system membrane component KefB
VITKTEAHLQLVLIGWGVIIIATWLAWRICRRLGQPLPVGEIAAGLLLGPSFLGLLAPGFMHTVFPEEIKDSLAILAEVGLMLMLFQVGMEFDFSHLRQKSKVVLASSIMGIAAPMVGGFVIGPWLHRTFAPEVPWAGFQIFVCVALSISSLPVMGRMLLEMKLERTALGATAISAAAIDDATGWILLGLATAVVKQDGHFSWLPFLGQILLVVLCVIVILKGVGPLLIMAWRKQCRDAKSENMTPGFLALLLCALFLCCLATSKLGIFAIFGAFALGVALHEEVTLVKAWRERFGEFVVVALVPIFFTSTGLNTNVGAFGGNGIGAGTAWIFCAVICAVAIAGKLGGCTFGARWAGATWQDSRCIGALMNTRALMGLVAVKVGRDLGLLNEQLFAMFVIMCLVTTASTAPLLRLWLPAELRKLLPR